ncbi:MAG: hypothetical protein OXM01_03730 [Gemmatimonadota bacterium]|nr:hypothetical protein [Gemmatimonadota bacterium]
MQELVDYESGVTTLEQGELTISFSADNPTEISNALKTLGEYESEDALSLINHIQEYYMTTDVPREAQRLADYMIGFSFGVKALAEDWAKAQEWAEKAAKDAKEAEKVARSRWAREGKSEELSASVCNAAEALVLESQNWAARALQLAERVDIVTSQALIVAQQVKRKMAE